MDHDEMRKAMNRATEPEVVIHSDPDGRWVLWQADCRTILSRLPDNCVDAIVTDPPYGLEFMGETLDAPWKQSGTVLHDPSVVGGFQDGAGGNPFSRSRIRYGREGDAMVQFQQWFTEIAAEALRVLKPGGHLLAFGGSRTYHRLACAVEDAGFEIRDQIMWVYGAGFPKSHNLKGDWEGWGTALKPAHEPIVVARKPLEGTVAANVLTWGTGALNIDGTRVGTGTGEERTVVDQGRWPANFIHDGSDEVLALAGDAARFFYCAKASKKERNAGLDTPSTHPTVKPIALMRYLIRLVTPPGGVVLDPFAGSGTTMAAALMEGAQPWGCEMTADYVPIILGRVGWALDEVESRIEGTL